MSCEPCLNATHVTFVASPATARSPEPAWIGPLSSIVNVLPASVTRGLSAAAVPV